MRNYVKRGTIMNYQKPEIELEIRRRMSVRVGQSDYD